MAARSIDGTARLVLTASFDARLPFVHPDMFGFDEEPCGAAQQGDHRGSRRSTTGCRVRSTKPAMERSARCRPRSTARRSPRLVTSPALGVSWIASIDLQGSGESVGSAGIVSNSDIVYASENNIYLATVPWDWNQPQADVPPNPEMPPTLIHEFSLGEGGTASYVASGEVPGQLLNQFSMSEFGGDLRVATTTTSVNGDQQPTSAVRVLRPEGNELVQIGEVDGLGTNEQIQAVRFLGTQAYVVTFRQTDPLFVIDLSDPTAPVLSGELKIPGYSAYLHPLATACCWESVRMRRTRVGCWARNSRCSMCTTRRTLCGCRRCRSVARVMPSGITTPSCTGPRTARSCCRCRPVGTTAAAT